MLGREWSDVFLHFMPILQLQPRFHQLHERECVTALTISLVPELASKINALNISEVIRFWNHARWNVFIFLELLHPGLGVLNPREKFI